MVAEQTIPELQTSAGGGPPDRAGVPAWLMPALWLFANLALAVAAAWASVQLQREGFNPIGVLSLLVGVVLGLGGVWIARRCEMRRMWVLVTGAVVFGLLAVIGQEYFGYRQYQRELQESFTRDAKRAREILLARSAFSALGDTYDQFVERRAEVNPWWHYALALDAILTAAAAAGATVVGLRTLNRSTQRSL